MRWSVFLVWKRAHCLFLFLRKRGNDVTTYIADLFLNYLQETLCFGFNFTHRADHKYWKVCFHHKLHIVSSLSDSWPLLVLELCDRCDQSGAAFTLKTLLGPKNNQKWPVSLSLSLLETGAYWISSLINPSLKGENYISWYSERALTVLPIVICKVLRNYNRVPWASSGLFVAWISYW